MVSGGRSSIRISITGTRISAVHSCWAVADSVSSGSNLRRSTSAEPSPMPPARCPKPQAWNSGAAIMVRSSVRSGIFENIAAIGPSELGVLRAAPFGVPVVPRREDHRLALLGGRDHGRRVALVDQLLERRVVQAALALCPGDEALAPLRALLDEVGELLVEDQRARALALDDVGDLRPGEGGVEVQRIDPELRAGDGGVDEAAVVAAHDRHAVALHDAAVGQPVREGVGRRSTSAKVSDPSSSMIAVASGPADRLGLIARGEGRAEASVGDADAQELVGTHRPQETGLHEGAHRGELVCHRHRRYPTTFALRSVRSWA